MSLVRPNSTGVASFDRNKIGRGDVSKNLLKKLDGCFEQFLGVQIRAGSRLQYSRLASDGFQAPWMEWRSLMFFCMREIILGKNRLFP